MRPAHVPVPVSRWKGGTFEPGRDDVAEECPVAFVYNGVPFSVMLATPLDLEDFARGFSLTEGIVDSPAEIQGLEIVPEETGYSLYVSVPRERTEALAARRRSLAGRTGCGLCGTQMLADAIRPIQPVRASTTIGPEAIQRAHDALASRQALNSLTGAVHAAAWADAAGTVRVVREDVGRHNALDKLVGALLADPAIEASEGMIIVTSRASYEMVHKTAAAGVSVLCAVSAPTALAVRSASAAGLTLVGFTREDRHTVYARPAPSLLP
ncbi:MAG: formate dehydrogenase accessory sulfurtransferase FdhD [Betaproteobacteria bacterium]|nr:formate dehydrogenase accessory sulfurtransferase FdhD [Betaproteobacteria bacterium]